MLIEIRAAPPFMKNGFVLADETTREGVVIDPGDDVEDLLAVVREEQLPIAWILLTHAHFDHITGVKQARAALGCPVVLHADDLPLYEAAVEQGVALRLPRRAAADAGPLLPAGRRLPLRRLRDPRAPHAGALAGRGLPRGDDAAPMDEAVPRRRR